MAAAGKIRAGMGGWTFEPWEGTFYPAGLPKKQQLNYAARQVPTIEVTMQAPPIASGNVIMASRRPGSFAKKIAASTRSENPR